MQVLRHDAGTVRWELARAAPGAALRGAVRRYEGYVEAGAEPVRRRELPGDTVTVILSFGAVTEVTYGGETQRLGSFVAGLDDGPALTACHAAEAGMVQIDLAPTAAHRLLGLPMRELAGRVVPLGDVVGARADLLVERLADRDDWPARFAVLDEVLGARLAETPPPTPVVMRALGRLRETHGTLRVGALVDELRCSRKHLSVLFGEQVGLAPKRLGRVLRFRRVLDALQAPGEDWARVAAACGYADQPHLNREFAAIAGVSPTALLSGQVAGGAGWAA